MTNERGFLEFKRKDPGYRPKEQRLQDYKAVEMMMTDDDIYQQATRCMNCGIPFCHGCGCPLVNVIPEFNDHVYNKRWKEALDILLYTNPFPEFTGRICPAPCEGSCVLGINDDPVAIRQIELAIIEKGFQRGYVVPEPPAERRKEHIAVIGSGPAGLAAAFVLNRAGFNVVVYENNKYPGGLLRYGIPEFKLEKWVVERRIQLMKDEGVIFETGVKVGEDISLRYIENRFDGILLTGGAQEPRDLQVPGRELDGIHFAMDFLVQQNMRVGGEEVDPDKEITAEGKNVVVIGGGDTGSDCLGTSLRQGAKKVYQFEIMPKPPETRSESTPWPEWPIMMRSSSSHKEGGDRRWCVNTTECVGRDGKVKGLRCVEIEWEKGEDGRMSLKNKPGTEFEVDAELVLLAMGFTGPGENRLVDQLELEKDARGNIKVNDANMTSKAGVFSAGDMARGQSLVVRAIFDGREAAYNMIDYYNEQKS